MSPPSTGREDRFGCLVKTFADPGFGDEVVIAYPDPHPVCADGRMDGEVHVGVEFHRLIIAN